MRCECRYDGAAALLSGRLINQPECLEAFKSHRNLNTGPNWFLPLPHICEHHFNRDYVTKSASGYLSTVSFPFRISCSLEKLDLPVCSWSFLLASEDLDFLALFFFPPAKPLVIPSVR